MSGVLYKTYSKVPKITKMYMSLCQLSQVIISQCPLSLFVILQANQHCQEDQWQKEANMHNTIGNNLGFLCIRSEVPCLFFFFFKLESTLITIVMI